MSEDEIKNTENSKNLEEQNLKEKLEEANETIAILRRANSFQDESFFRMMLVEGINSISREMEIQNQALNSMVKKISNQNKILAAKLGVDIE